MKIWVISDTHGKESELIIPSNIDMIISAGDGGTYKNPKDCEKDLDNFLKWFNELPIEYKIYIPGNHDTALEAGLIDEMEYLNIIILKHEFIKIAGLNIFGSPYTPEFYNWAYNSTKKELKVLWEDIPEELNLLITHGPPRFILDKCRDGYRAGCDSLAQKIVEVEPIYHIFGHIHEDGGKEEEHGCTTYINASVLDLYYNKSNNGQIIEI